MYFLGQYFLLCPSGKGKSSILLYMMCYSCFRSYLVVVSYDGLWFLLLIGVIMEQAHFKEICGDIFSLFANLILWWYLVMICLMHKLFFWQKCTNHLFVSEFEFVIKFRWYEPAWFIFERQMPRVNASQKCSCLLVAICWF